jgi:hypothetical protein
MPSLTELHSQRDGALRPNLSDEASCEGPEFRSKALRQPPSPAQVHALAAQLHRQRWGHYFDIQFWNRAWPKRLANSLAATGILSISH